MKKFLKKFSLLGFLMLGLCVVLGVGDVSGAVVMADGAAADIATNGDPNPSPANDGGTATQHGEKGDALSTWDYRKWAPDLIQDPVERQVIQIRPYANVLDTILSYIGSDKINNLEYSYWQIMSRDLAYTIGKFEQSWDDNKERVEGYLYLVGGSKVNATDNLLVKTGEDGDDLVLYVISTENTTATINGVANTKVQKLRVTTDEEQVVAGEAGTDYEGKYAIPATALVYGAKCYQLGRSAGELDTTSPAIEYVPTKKKGYAQIFKTEITMSNYAKMADKEVKWDLSEIEEEAMFDYRRTKEKSFLFGRMSKIYDPVKDKEIYRCDGIFRNILKKQGSPTVVHCGQTTQKAANDELTEMMKTIFVGNNGAKERFMLAGSNAVAMLTKMMGVAQKQQGALETEVIMGITWTKIVSPFGILNLVSHPIFDETPYADYALVIDPQFLKKKEVLPMERQQVDGKEHLIVNGDIVIFTETAGVAVYNPKAHHVLKMVATAA